MDNQSLFSSAHSALVFAFNASAQCYERPMMNKLAAPAFGTGKGLGKLDGAGQAGMIRREVQQLGRLAEALLIVRFSQPYTPCSCRRPCCSGKKANPEREAAIGYLADYIRTAALASCSCHGLLRREYLERYFVPKAQRKSLDAIADEYNINRKSSIAYYGKVALLLGGKKAGNGSEAVNGLEDHARMAIEDKLRELKIVG